MPALIRMLDIARRALNAHQNAMGTASHNIANANTEGYSRQRVILTPSRQIATSYGLLGAGVDVGRIERIRNKFIDRQLTNERPSLTQFEFKSNALGFIEGVFNEPSDFGLNKLVDDFFGSLQDLSNDPESLAARTVVKERAVSLASGFNRIHRQLTEYSQQLNVELKGKVDEVNRLSSEIAHLNQKIVNAEVGGSEASGLRDRRDLLIDNLSKLANIKTSENQFGAVNVALGGNFLVVETTSQKIALDVPTADEMGPQVVFEQGGAKVNITNGSLKGVLDIRDNNIVDYLKQLDELAITLAAEVNTIHEAGFNLDGITGISFFKDNVTGADNFKVSTEILNDASLIATADLTNEPGNNSTALALANLQDSLVMSNSRATMSDFFNSLIVSVGSQTQEANLLRESFSVTVDKLEFERDSVSGVSIDEELTNLIEAQQAYTAATRVITTVDEMIQTVLNMV